MTAVRWALLSLVAALACGADVRKPVGPRAGGMPMPAPACPPAAEPAPETPMSPNTPKVDLAALKSELVEQHGDHDPETFWPVLKLKLPPEVFERYESTLRGMPGGDDAAKFAALLDRVSLV